MTWINSAVSNSWHRPLPTNEERAAELREAEREVTRFARRLLLETLLGCVLCCSAGLYLVAWALHTSDAGWGAIAFWSGLLVGDSGMMFFLLRHHAQSEEFGL